MPNIKASLPVIRRLPRYYRYITELKNKGVVRVSSSQLANIMGS
ncbi:MAG: redox-sensing transcriptional repressor Rex, partial [Oscillospiraceae bacterium]|nr:redox-sensing transcriptional repressor Rex [Oscillospiraceae bacterium]